MTNRDAWPERAPGQPPLTMWQRQNLMIEAIHLSIDRARSDQQLRPVEVIDHDTGKRGKVLFPMGEL